MEDLNRFVPRVHFELIPIKNLVSNQNYQRGISAKHVARTSDNFDLYQINPVKVSRRDGMNYVFNGQHTIEIVAAVSGSRETPVWCMVYDDMDYEVEADVFANQQKYVKTLSFYEIFQANVEAGNDEQTTIKSLVESYGLTVAAGKQQGSICAVSSLEYIYEKYGYHVLDRTLRLCIGTWEGELNSLASGMLKGIAKLIDVYGDSLNDDIFKEKLGSVSAKEISRTAKERKCGTMGYAEAMVKVYNRKMKAGLKWGKLYNSNDGNAGGNKNDGSESEEAESETGGEIKSETA